MMKKLFFDKLIYVITFLVTSFLLEMMVFLRLDFGAVPTYIMFNITYYVIVSGLIFLAKKRKTKLFIAIFLLVIQVLINCINMCYFKALGDIFSFDLLKLGAEAAGAMSASFLDFPGILLNVAMLVLAIFSMVYFTKSKEKPIENAKKKVASVALVMATIMCFSTLGMSTGLIAVNTLSNANPDSVSVIENNDQYLFENFHFKREAFKKFGSAGFYTKSLYDLVFSKGITEEEKKELETYLTQNVVAENPTAPLYGNNLITVMLESFEWFAIDPVCTPTLYSFANGGAISFSNFRGRNKTNISEAIGILGNSIRQGDFITLACKGGFAPKNSLAYMFRDKGYTANFFHPFDGEFYSRHIVNNSYGFENNYALQDIGWAETPFGKFYLEEDFVKHVSNEIAPSDKPFYSFYLTVGTHGPYGDENDRYKQKGYYDIYDQNFDQIKAYLESQGFYVPTDQNSRENLRKYKVAAMDTDRAIKAILDDLESKGELDNTTIVLYSDHNCYYDNLGLYVRYNSIDVNVNTSDIYNIPFFIYDQKLLSDANIEKKNDDFCNTYDIYPTICELFGLSYSKNLTQGYNVFGEDIEKSFFASFLTAMFDDKIYSFNISDCFITSSGQVSESEILDFKKHANDFYQKQEKIDGVYNAGLNNR